MASDQKRQFPSLLRILPRLRPGGKDPRHGLLQAERGCLFASQRFQSIGILLPLRVHDLDRQGQVRLQVMAAHPLQGHTSRVPSKQLPIGHPHEQDRNGPVDTVLLKEIVPGLVECLIHHTVLQEPLVEIPRQLARHLHGHLVLHGHHRRNARFHQLGTQADEGMCGLPLASGALAGRQEHQVGQAVAGRHDGHQFVVPHDVQPPVLLLQVESRYPLALLFQSPENTVPQKVKDVVTGQMVQDAVQARGALSDKVPRSLQPGTLVRRQPRPPWQDRNLVLAAATQVTQGLEHHLYFSLHFEGRKAFR